MAIALVTGSTSGIGAAFAERLAARGYDLVLVARTAPRLEAQAEQLRHRYGGAVEVLPADLADPLALLEIEARLAAEPFDLLVNNAGFGTNRRFADGAIDEEERQLDVLVRAVLRLTHAAVGPMIRRGSGAVINVSSVAAFVPGGTYAAAKAWVTYFSEGLAGELEGKGVKVMAVCPGFTHTEFHERGGMDVSAIPERLWLTPDEVVDGALADLARGRRVSIPSGTYKVLATVARHAPHRLVTAVYSRARPKR